MPPPTRTWKRRWKKGRFAKTCFHRLNVIRVHVPALRDRREDVPLLTRRFLDRSATELNVEPKLMPEETQAFLNQLDWPGNVRQLENLCRWVTVMAPGKEIHIDDLPPEIRAANAAPGADWGKRLASLGAIEPDQGQTRLTGRRAAPL